MLPCFILSVHRVASGQGKVREFCAGSGKFGILRKVREIRRLGNVT